MQFVLSGEIYAATGIAELNHKYIDEFLEYFQDKTYSPELNRVVIFFICRPGGPYKQRRKFNKERGALYLDVMLDYTSVMQTVAFEKEKYYLESFTQVFPLLEKFRMKIKEFQSEDLANDLKLLLKRLSLALLSSH